MLLLSRTLSVNELVYSANGRCDFTVANCQNTCPYLLIRHPNQQKTPAYRIFTHVKNGSQI